MKRFLRTWVFDIWDAWLMLAIRLATCAMFMWLGYYIITLLKQAAACNV